MMGAFFPYSATTDGFTVRVAVSYMPDQSEPGNDRWFWAYHIRIENHGDQTAQLLTRHWEITDSRGAKSIIDGEGVVGDQPVIHPGGSYDYVSGCPLMTSTGNMVGSYQMMGEDGAHFDVAVPRFALHADGVKG